MFDEKSLDRMNFGDLNKSLGYVLKTIGEIEAALPEGEDDPRLDTLYVTANKIIVRMDSIIREDGRSTPEVLAQWNKSMAGYEKGFEKYADTLLGEDTLSDSEELEISLDVSSANEPTARQAGEKGELFDEKLLDGLNEADLHQALKHILAEVKRIDEEDPDNDDDPRIGRLLDVAKLVIERLDPLTRERLRDNPAALAEWDEIYHSCDDLNDDLDEQVPADAESPTIS
jgi:hypothetical protein